MALLGLLFPKRPTQGWAPAESGSMSFQPVRKRSPSQCPGSASSLQARKTRRIAAELPLTECCRQKKADMTITAMSAFPYLPVWGDLPVPEGISYARRTGGPAEPAGLFSRFPHQYTMSEPAGKGQIRAKFFGVEGEREGEAAPFVHKRGASPSHLSFPPTAGDPARAGRWPRPHGRERWRPCPPSRRWYGPDAAPGCRRGRRGPGRARPAP